MLVVAGAPRTWRQHAYVCTIGVRSAVLSHRAAGVLHGLEGLGPPAIEVVVPNGSRAPKAAAALVDRVHQSRTLRSGDITVVDGIACTGVARTLCDLADVLDDELLVRILDDIQRKGFSLRWLEHTARRLVAPGRGGPRRVLDLVAERSGGYRVPDSWFERLLEACLGSRLLHGLVRQHEIRRPDSTLVARVDLALPDLRLGFEAHSRSYHLGREVERADEDRDLEAAKLGWEIVYLGFAAARTPDRIRADLEAVAVRRHRDLGRPV